MSKEESQVVLETIYFILFILLCNLVYTVNYVFSANICLLDY